MESLCLGVARENITPEIGGQLYGYRPNIFSESVADELTVTVYYFQQGKTKALMISGTVCLISTELSHSILSLIEQKFHIPRQNCMLCATHTHSGPNTSGQSGWGDIDSEYCEERFVPAILSATEKAIKSVQPVKMGIAHGVSLVGINRRELNENNNIILGQNPWGPYNPEMTVLSFVDADEKTVANLIHYAAHGTAAGANHEITRDWSGVMIDALEKQSGGITAFFNGPEGDVGPRISNGKTVGNLDYVHEIGELAAKDALAIFGKISSYSDVKLSVSNQKLTIPLKNRMSFEESKTMFERYKNETVNLPGMMRKYFEEVIDSYNNGFVDKKAVEAEQVLIALGDVVFASFAYELFSEIGMRIDRAIKTKSVLSLSNTNGSEGYFITQDAICRGGYEVDMFLYGHLQQITDDADFYLMQETVKHIQNLINEE